MTAPDRYISEKRDFIRMTVESPAKIIWQGKQLDGTCIDLSAIGAKVLTKETIPLGTQVTFEVPSQIERFNSLIADAEVTRCEVVGEQYEIGLKVLEVK
ncbi:PilZ domain-containing protein [Salinibius halmophilus]|uniref:PilZ domain-containing protein n=1 Tax=Salinibius halmophilus TaxID=1853216 RepID=UPI000E66E35A|nr:PilZ domain-containing protein [Salinibius halmophilus]